MGFIIAMVHTNIEPTQNCISVQILLPLSFNLLPDPQSYGFKIPYSQLRDNKEAIPNFSNSTDHLSNRARPISEFTEQCNFLLYSICWLSDLVTGCLYVKQKDEYKLQMLRTFKQTYHSYPFCLSFCGPNAERKEVSKNLLRTFLGSWFRAS
jgi:hypothetical protein